MAHNLFGERFGDAREPAWHKLGKVFDEKVTATAAYKRLGRYEVELIPAMAGDTPIGKNAILRRPTTDDPETRVFGIVGEDYSLVTPDDVCSIFDEQVGVPIETIGALGYGETFFVSTQLPTLDVKGDEVENYLLVSNPMTGLQSAEVRVTPVRVVCQNTLIASDHAATQKLKIVHDKDAKQRMAEWLRETYEFAETTSKVLGDLFTLMARQRVRDAEARKLFAHAYPTPTKPKGNAPQHVMEQRIRWWEENVSLMERRRSGSKELFEGMGTGMDSSAAKGTLWGAYNAVVECEDYRKGREDGQIAASAMYGERAAAKKRAFEYAVKQVEK
jgi:phage/plasmid-like protein (TIGR03299 family)